ncbi:MAG TPA: DNA polymerase IV [Candidatus Acidoferrales bacterium]|nr:DNA polymerase IV [Candidatus Acidoferrales bacterium]
MKHIAHVDMDAFFVSVELLTRPELKGKPVVVGAPGDQRGVVASASYEARAFGIHSAMPSRTAKKLCPHCIFLPGSYGLYEKYSRQVRAIFERFTPVVQMVSIDEAYLDLTGTERLHGSPLCAAQKIQRSVADETRLPCSIGLGSSYVVAKVASDAAKPRGILWVPPGTEAAFLAPLPVRRIPGIGPVAEKELKKLGVTTVGELAALEHDRLVEVFGQWGESLYRKARGEDAELWFVRDEQKSISHERTFLHDVGDPEELEATLAYLAQLVGQRLRAAKLHARTVTLKLRYASFETITRAHTLPAATDLDDALFQTARELFRRAWDRKQKVRLLGIAAGSLGEAPAQLGLLDAAMQERAEKLARAADELRERLGPDAVQTARTLLRKPSVEGVNDRPPLPAFTKRK